MIEAKSVSFATGASSPEGRRRWGELEAVDAGIERLIQRRAEAPDPDEADERYRRSCERYAELHDRLADEHRQRAVSLAGVGGVDR